MCNKLTRRAWQVIFGGCQCPGDPAGSLLWRLCWCRCSHSWGLRRSGGSWLLHGWRAWVWSHCPGRWTWADRRLQRSCSNATSVSHANRNASCEYSPSQMLTILILSSGDSIFPIGCRESQIHIAIRYMDRNDPFPHQLRLKLALGLAELAAGSDSQCLLAGMSSPSLHTRILRSASLIQAAKSMGTGA